MNAVFMKLNVLKIIFSKEYKLYLPKKEELETEVKKTTLLK